MIRKATKIVETLSFRVHVQQRDIDDGKCMLVAKCMHKVAVERALRDLDPKGGDHKVRIDAQICKFNFQGYRYHALVPKPAKLNLLQFDKERKARARADRDGVKFVSKVRPHSYRLEAQKGTKIQPFTRERQEQVNEARRRRVAAGKPDKPKYDLRYRVEGLGTV
jgi:hypothetical protein